MDTAPREELAIIEQIGVGIRDAGTPIVWFGVQGLGFGALIVWSWEEASDQISLNQVTNLLDLNGRPCVVSIDRSSVTFQRLFKS